MNGRSLSAKNSCRADPVDQLSRLIISRSAARWSRTSGHALIQQRNAPGLSAAASGGGGRSRSIRVSKHWKTVRCAAPPEGSPTSEPSGLNDIYAIFVIHCAFPDQSKRLELSQKTTVYCSTTNGPTLPKSATSTRVSNTHPPRRNVVDRLIRPM